MLTSRYKKKENCYQAVWLTMLQLPAILILVTFSMVQLTTWSRVMKRFVVVKTISG